MHQRLVMINKSIKDAVKILVVIPCQMECCICHTRPTSKSSFTCPSCIKKNVKKWSEIIDGKEQEKLDFISRNENLWTHRHLNILHQRDEKDSELSDLDIIKSLKIIKKDEIVKERIVVNLQKQVKRIQQEISFQQKRYQDLLSIREELKRRNTFVDLLQGQSGIQDSVNSPKSKKEEANRKDLVKYKKMLIRDLLTIFKLRKVRMKSQTVAAPKASDSKGKLEEELHDNITYRIVTVGPPSKNLFNSSSISHLQVKKLNAFLFYSSHLLLLLSFYLNIPLPFPIYFKSGLPWIRFEVLPIPSHDQSQTSTSYKAVEFITTGLKPLFMELDSSNNENLLLGFATLNYNISWLAKTQGENIPLSETSDTLRMLALMCASPSLGLNNFSDPLTNFISRPEPLEYDLDEVVQVHLDLATKPWEVIDAEPDIPEDNINDDWNVVDEL